MGSGKSGSNETGSGGSLAHSETPHIERTYALDNLRSFDHLVVPGNGIVVHARRVYPHFAIASHSHGFDPHHSRAKSHLGKGNLEGFETFYAGGFYVEQ